MTPPTNGGRDRGLDALNLLLAAMGTAYGAFIPVYLTAQAWTQTHIGLVLTVGRYRTPALVDIDREGIQPDFGRMPGRQEAVRIVCALV